MAKDSDGGGKGDGKPREIILERRKFFIASAVAGLAWSSCNRSEPQPCLSQPMVCLSPMPIEEVDGGTRIDAGDDATANEPADAGAPANSAGVDPSGTRSVDTSAAASGSADAGVPKPPPPAPKPPTPVPRPCLKMAVPPDALKKK